MWEFMGWWNDVKISELDQGIEDLSIKEVVEGSLDDLKENEECMLVFANVESCHMVSSNMGECSISRA